MIVGKLCHVILSQTAGWLSRQVTAAFPWDTVRDRDASYGRYFRWECAGMPRGYAKNQAAIRMGKDWRLLLVLRSTAIPTGGR